MRVRGKGMLKVRVKGRVRVRISAASLANRSIVRQSLQGVGVRVRVRVRVKVRVSSC